MSGMGQPSLTSLQGDANYDPTIQDWQNAYKPVDKALNKMFETRITNANARQVQFQLAVVSRPAPTPLLELEFVLHVGKEFAISVNS